MSCNSVKISWARRGVTGISTWMRGVTQLLWIYNCFGSFLKTGIEIVLGVGTFKALMFWLDAHLQLRRGKLYNYAATYLQQHNDTAPRALQNFFCEFISGLFNELSSALLYNVSWNFLFYHGQSRMWTQLSYLSDLRIYGIRKSFCL